MVDSLGARFLWRRPRISASWVYGLVCGQGLARYRDEPSRSRGIHRPVLPRVIVLSGLLLAHTAGILAHLETTLVDNRVSDEGSPNAITWISAPKGRDTTAGGNAPGRIEPKTFSTLKGSHNNSEVHNVPNACKITGPHRFFNERPPEFDNLGNRTRIIRLYGGDS